MSLTLQILQQSAMPKLTEHNYMGNLGKTMLQVTQKNRVVQVELFSKNPEAGEDGASLTFGPACFLGLRNISLARINSTFLSLCSLIMVVITSGLV